LPNSNIVVSKFAVSERWLKLYRTVFHQFLKFDFTHKQDYLDDIAQLNARISELELRLGAELSKIQSGVTAHVHPAPQSSSGTIPTLVSVKPAYISGFSSTSPIVHKETFLEQRDAALQATGPAQAPLGDGSSPEAVEANITSRDTVGA